MRNTILAALFFLAVGAQAQDTFYLYRSCTNAKGDRLELFADTMGQAARPSMLRLFSFAYSGTSNENLTEFVSADGKLRVRIEVDRYGRAKTAEAEGFGFKKTFETCFENSDGGSSVNVHN